MFLQICQGIITSIVLHVQTIVNMTIPKNSYALMYRYMYLLRIIANVKYLGPVPLSPASRDTELSEIRPCVIILYEKSFRMHMGNDAHGKMG